MKLFNPCSLFYKERGFHHSYMPFILQVIRKEKNIPVVSPVTLMLCLWAASMTAGTRSSAGSPWSSATPGGYQDKTRTPGATQSTKKMGKGRVRYADVLTGHFIRYTKLGWQIIDSTLCTRSWRQSSEIDIIYDVDTSSTISPHHKGLTSVGVQSSHC